MKSTCDICLKLDFKNKIYYRSHLYNWESQSPRNTYSKESNCTLCQSCTNRVQLYVSKKQDYFEILKLIRKLKKVISHEQKIKDSG